MEQTAKDPPTGFPPERRGRAAVQELARALADNYFDVTFGYPHPPERFFERYRAIFKKDRDLVAHPRVRNVVVVGAGASYGAFGGTLFPMARQAIDTLRDGLGVNGLRDALRSTDAGTTGPTDRFAEEELLFQQLHGIDDARWDFETQLAILSKFYTPRQIRSALAKIYSRQYYPHFTFEIIAHLLKHRLVDVVVNYNFDEVLDQAIREEVRGGDYRMVISDGDCVDLSKLVVGEQLKVPLYIKPHGTISHKSTLRFTKDAYVGMPGDLATFTTKILDGATLEDTSRQRDRFRVNLISIGFAFTSVELIQTLKHHDRLRIFHVNIEGDENEAALRYNVGRLKAPVEQYFIGITPPKKEKDTREDDAAMPAGNAAPGDIPRAEPGAAAPAVTDEAGAGSGAAAAPAPGVDAPTASDGASDGAAEPASPPDGKGESWPSIAHALGAVYDEVCTRYGDHQPRNVDRHLIVHHLLFSPAAAPAAGAGAEPGKRLPLRDRDYFLARLYVELTLALAKGRGRIDLTNLVHDRVGIYFSAWREVEPGAVVPLRKLCERLGMDDREGFAGNIFSVRRSDGPALRDPDDWFFPGAKPDPLTPAPGAPLLGVESVESRWKRSEFAAVLWRNLLGVLKAIDDREFREHLEAISAPDHAIGNFVLGALSNQAEADVVELAPRFSPDALLLLNRPSAKAVIHTKLGITIRFAEMLENPDWDLMLCVSEHGRVLHSIHSHLERAAARPDAPARRIRHRASIVVADSHARSLNERLLEARERGLLIGDPYRLPYWVHNDHMMVAMRMGVHPGAFTPLAAISYRRVGLESRVNPMYIEDQDDLKLLVQTFFGYVTKARAYVDRNGVRTGVPDILAEQATSTRAELQLEWWTEMMREAAARESGADGREAAVQMAADHMAVEPAPVDDDGAARGAPAEDAES